MFLCLQIIPVGTKLTFVLLTTFFFFLFYVVANIPGVNCLEARAPNEQKRNLQPQRPATATLSNKHNLL